MKLKPWFYALILILLLLTACISRSEQDKIEKNIEVQEKMPSIELLYPKGGEILSNIVKIKWQTENVEQNSAYVNIYYTTDLKQFCPTCPPQKWHLLAESLDYRSNGYEWDTRKFKNSDFYSIKLELVAGAYIAEDETEDYIKVRN